MADKKNKIKKAFPTLLIVSADKSSCLHRNIVFPLVITTEKIYNKRFRSVSWMIN